MLNRKTETKYIGQYVTTVALQDGISPFQPAKFENVTQTLGEKTGGVQYWSVALPAMVQGQTDINRIGDRLEPVSHQVKMTLRFASQSLGGDPPTFQAPDKPLDLTAYIFYGYVKSMKTYSGAGVSLQGTSLVVSGQTEAARAMARLLDDGDLTFSTFTGDPILAQQPLSEYVNMKVKKVHFRRGGGWINSNVGNGGAAQNTAADNTLSRQLTLKFKPPSKLLYTNSTDLYPDNYAPVFAVGYVFNDPEASGNQTAPDYGEGQLEYVAQAQMWFKDHQ